MDKLNEYIEKANNLGLDVIFKDEYKRENFRDLVELIEKGSITDVEEYWNKLSKGADVVFWDKLQDNYYTLDFLTKHKFI